MKSLVEIRIVRPDVPARSIISDASFFQPDGGDLVFPSAIAADSSVSDHLKWLYGMLQHRRRSFRQLEAAGATIIVSIRTCEKPLCLPPEALLLMHQLHLPTELHIMK